ncbi:hypothetical protein PACTADRAFT_42541 [Pachysolen tannophilus NRRL Y-2460]|uniref:NADH dehydrogenase [ubiquinone] 1 alpha subcomplex assembly factor 3 n=1 Tax=Pachysolen tannophilus NRRL Y-2460 TaxID=669874 RepID=A0A1E4TUA3_PACTA|nr:hypothetical protein PACTADRAFT_42541 [Pachysolen tannophilus NRRL Y-2460]
MRVSVLERLLKRCFHTSLILNRSVPGFKPANVGQRLSQIDILGAIGEPKNNIEMISNDSIIFSNLSVIKSPNRQGHVMASFLLNNEIYQLNLSKNGFNNYKDFMIEILDQDGSGSIFQFLELIHPKPELLVIGLGKKSRILHENTKKSLSKLGIQYEVSDTKHAVLSYDLLATERSPSQVAAILLPPNI